MYKQEAEHIIIKFFTGEISHEEQAILDQWISHSVENKKEFEAYSELWEKSKDLAISDTLDVESSLIQTKKQIVGMQSRKRWIVYLRQAAAVILISLSLTFLYNYFLNNRNSKIGSEQVVMQEIKAAYGTHSKLQLADGTNVCLNSGSTLRFPISFNNLEERKVELNGEGYFEVTKNDTKPFIVNTSELDVKVYGTSFNVMAYDEYNSMSVALVEGEVRLIKNYTSGPKELMTLKPNDVIEYHSDNNKLYHSSELNMKKYTSWKDGYIVFFDNPINNVIQKLEKWYNVEIEIKDEVLQNYSFTATFADESLVQVLNLLSLSSPMSYKITPAQKQKDNSYSIRKVILSLKK